MVRYKDVGDDWITPCKKYLAICCDCGLCHNFYFRIYKGQIQFKVKRNNISTALVRRKK